MKINTDKCEVMTLQDQNVNFGGEPIKNVNKFIFLGSLIPSKGLDIKRRIGHYTKKKFSIKDFYSISIFLHIY